MPERTGAHCLYDRFAAAVRRQITIAIPGSLRKKPRRRQRLSPRAAHNEIRIPLPASVQRNSRRRCRTQPLRARRTLPPPDQQHDAQIPAAMPIPITVHQSNGPSILPL